MKAAGGGLLLGSALFVTAAAAEDLGTIYVESSTISDRFEQKRSEPSSIAVISGEQADRQHPENIQQLLQSIPGITTEVQSGDSLKIHIRGVENQAYMGENPGVAVVIDGVPVFERTGRVNIDLDNIESIKVVKGGASYLYGNDALSGAVIITTKRGADRAGYRVAAEAGSFGYYKGLASAGFANASANGHLQVSRRTTDGYYEDSDSQADYINGKLQYYLDDHSDLTFGIELSEREKDSHGAVRGVDAADEDPESTDPAYNDYARRFDVDLQKYFVTYARDVGAASALMVNAYRFTDDTQFVSDPNDDDPELYNRANDYEQVQQGLKSEWRTSGRLTAWMIGGELRDNSYENRTIATQAFWGNAVGDVVEDNITDEKVAAVYGEVKFRPADPLTLTLNGRYDEIDLDYTDYEEPTDSGERSYAVGSWRLGANYAVSPSFDLYGNASTGFRTPTVEQLFVGRYSPAGETAPNPDLEAEYSLNLELGIRSKFQWGATPMELDAAVFQLDRYDYINSTSGLYSGGPDAVYDNVGDVRSRGLELVLLARPSPRWWWDAAYTYLDARYTDYENFDLLTEPVAGSCLSGEPITEMTWKGPAVVACSESFDNTGNTVPRVPKHHLNLRVFNRPAPHWTVMGELDATSSYYADEINREKIGGHATLNLLITYDRKIGAADGSFFLRIDNLLDRRYYNTVRGHGDQNEDGVYDEEDISIVVNPGRTFTAGFTAEF